MKWNQNFFLLMSGQSVANAGDVLYIVCVISSLFQMTGSAAIAAMVPFFITTCMFAANFGSPLLFQKFNLKWLLAGSQCGKTLLLFALAILLPKLSPQNLVLIFLILGCIALLDGCAHPVSRTLVPCYVQSEQLLKANSLLETAAQLIQTAMWFAGSSLLLVIDESFLVWLVFGLFALSSLFLCFLEPVNFSPSKEDSFWDQAKSGWKVLFASPILKRIAAMDFLEAIAGTAWIAAILYVFVEEALQTDERWWGFINGSFFFGLITGSVCCLKFSSIIERNRGAFILWGSVFGSLTTFFFGVTSMPIVAVLLSFLFGVFGQLKNIPQQTVVQTSVPNAQLPNVYASLSAIGTGAFGAASLIMGKVSDLYGIRAAFLFSSALLAAASLVAFSGKALLVNNEQKGLSYRS